MSLIILDVQKAFRYLKAFNNDGILLMILIFIISNNFPHRYKLSLIEKIIKKIHILHFIKYRLFSTNFEKQG